MEDFVREPHSNLRRRTGTEGWSRCATAVRDYDRRIVRSWHQELDTLLVFAALFSAIVTAFLVESTKNSEDESRVGSRAVIINSFWLCSLILSINSVLVTILLKQWLAEYSWDVGTSVLTPKQSFALRHLRFQQLQKWHIPALIDYLPLLLIIAVLLFYAGLVTFMWNLHPVTAGIGTSLVGVASLFFIYTTIIPSWSPLSPYQSSQAWLSYSLARFTRRLFVAKEDQFALDADSKPTNWVDHGIRAIRSRQDAEIEFQGLTWIQRSLGPWDPELIQKVFACALSLTPESTRAPIIRSLFIQHIPKSVLNSEDPEDGVQFASILQDALGPNIIQASFLALHSHLSDILDSDKQFPSPLAVSIDEQAEGIQALLVLVRLTFPEKIAIDGWTLLFALIAPKENLKEWDAIRRRVLDTFLDDLLLSRAVGDAGDSTHRARRRLGWNIVQGGFHHPAGIDDAQGLTTSILAISTLPKGSVTAFHLGGTTDDELEWVLRTSCVLFRLASLPWPGPDGELASMTNELVGCWDGMVSYLNNKLEADKEDDKILKAVWMWAQILCYRSSPWAPYRVARLLNTGDPTVDTRIRLQLQALLEVLFVAVESVPQAGDVKVGLSALRLLCASDAQVSLFTLVLQSVLSLTLSRTKRCKSVRTLLLQHSEDSAMPYSADNESLSLTSQLHGLCLDETFQIGWILVKELASFPWGHHDLRDNYQNFLLICVILCRAAAKPRPASDIFNSELVKRCCLEASKVSLRLIAADSDEMVLLDAHHRERLERAILALLGALSKLVSRSLTPSWVFDRDTGTELEGDIGKIAFATMLTVVPKDRPHLMTTLTSMSQWRFIQSETWSGAEVSKLCKFVESMTAFLEQPQAKECLMLNGKLDVGWFEPILAMITAVVLDPLSHPTTHTCQVFITFISAARKFSGNALNVRKRYEDTLKRLSQFAQPRETEIDEY
ncbi:hypothetical protein MD484_g5272, partial [Candolleomyces efflorescens]